MLESIPEINMINTIEVSSTCAICMLYLSFLLLLLSRHDRQADLSILPMIQQSVSLDHVSILNAK